MQLYYLDATYYLKAGHCRNTILLILTMADRQCNEQKYRILLRRLGNKWNSLGKMTGQAALSIPHIASWLIACVVSFLHVKDHPVLPRSTNVVLDSQGKLAVKRSATLCLFRHLRPSCEFRQVQSDFHLLCDFRKLHSLFDKSCS